MLDIRLKQLHNLIAEFGSQKRFADKVGLAPAYISQMVTERRSIGEKVARKIESACGKPAGWMDNTATGEGSMRGEGGNVTRKNVIPVPILDVRASMGEGESQTEETIVGTMPLSKEWIKGRNIRLSSLENLRTISAFGDSMSPTFNSGDIMLVDAGINQVDVDGIYVLQTDSSLFVKRVSRSLSGGYIISSDNKSISQTDKLNGDILENGQSIEVLGRVVYAWNGKVL